MQEEQNRLKIQELVEELADLKSENKSSFDLRKQAKKLQTDLDKA